MQNFGNLQFPANIHEGTFSKLCHIARHVYIYVDIGFYNDKLFRWYSKNL